jgi:formylglycine-generating enzyme required for sulfatase activity
MKSTLYSLFASIGIACFLTQGNLAAQIPQSALDAQKVLKQHCYKCHGENGVAVAGLNVLNWKQLTGADGFIVPKAVGESSLYDYMDGGGMPPEDDDRVKVMPTQDEIKVIKDWILAGAPDFEQEIVREFISPEQMVGFIENDLRKNVEARERKHMRYFTLTHLYNANIPDAEIDTYRLAISKLINSLSWNRDVAVPVAIDPKKTVYRIDLRDYNWDIRHDAQSPPVWDAIVAQSPYNVEYSFTAANYCSTATSHALPFVRGDWFVAAASRPPLYHQILEIPENVIALEKRLGVDVLANINREKVTRAAFTRSGVSDNNRLIERHDSVNGAYWISYDFAGNQGRQLLTSHPLGPGDDPSYFKHDGGEVIFNLPNGLQAYMLITADGTRIDKGPTSIVKDPDDIARDGGAVVNGISCMHCHDQGMKLKDDEIRLFVAANPVAFGNNPDVIGAINALYPVQPAIDKLYTKDARRHIEAAEKTGSPIVQEAEGVQLKLVDGKPVVRLSTQFHNELNLELAAAEAGVKREVFKAILSQSEALAKQLGLLKIKGKTVKRDTYVAAYADIVKELRLGRYVPSRNRSAVIFANKPVITNTLGMKLKLIPAGTFLMGSHENEQDRQINETQHEVTISKAFYMQTIEVTQGQWKAMMGTEPWKDQDENDIFVNEGPNHPAVYLSWDDAIAYCKKLSEKEGRTYRLPTEAEWEYACRAGTTTLWSFGNEKKELGDHAWYEKNTSESYGASLGGLKKPNAFGLYDMHGNVWEWCHDYYERHYYTQSPEKDPTGPIQGSFRVLRGGCWLLGSLLQRSAMRHSEDAVRRDALQGFRVVLESDDSTQSTPPSVPTTAPRKESITNTIGMTLNEVPAGSFMMGSHATKEGRGDDEHQHKITISKAFYMQTTEVTQGQWKAVMETEPWKGQSFVKEGANYPVVQVSWDDAVSYCKRLSEKEGKTYRLPTEAEWEYACRAGTTTTWSFGDDEKALGDYAWHKKNTLNIGERYAHPVELKKPNAFGLYDMHGNIYEWCYDYYNANYYKQSLEQDPKGPATGSSHSFRGGSWFDLTIRTSTAFRNKNIPDFRNHDIGFRIVLEAD